ncbi:MAG: ATP-binding protein [Rhodocyclales bacterium]|nr:ATP-binding protein [Rhodocyclales bacterium]
MVNEIPAGDETALRAEITRLNKIVTALVNRAERETGAKQSHFGLFQNAVMLENQVRRRTAELEEALRENERINRDLTREREEQRILIKKLEEAHNQLLQSEKLASIGQLAAGVAHEINNPIGFVNSNLGALQKYCDSLLGLLDQYEGLEGELKPESSTAIRSAKKKLDLDFLREDLVDLIAESIDGTDRVRRIVQDLRDFSRTGGAEWQRADVHAGLESTLNVVSNEVKYKADVVRDYGELPEIECLPQQLNQVFLNLLVNAAQAIPERGTITLRTRCEGGWVRISIIDNGAGIPPEIREKIFDPFFTTKPIGKGTGLGLSVTYGIVDKHKGRIELESEVGKGTSFTICLPVNRPEEG